MQKYGQPFNRGCRGNWETVFGRNPWLDMTSYSLKYNVWLTQMTVIRTTMMIARIQYILIITIIIVMRVKLWMQ